MRLAAAAAEHDLAADDDVRIHDHERAASAGTARGAGAPVRSVTAGVPPVPPVPPVPSAAGLVAAGRRAGWEIGEAVADTRRLVEHEVAGDERVGLRAALGQLLGLADVPLGDADLEARA